MADLVEQLEMVARRGSPRGASSVLDAANHVAERRSHRRRNGRLVVTGVVALSALAIVIAVVRRADDTQDISTTADHSMWTPTEPPAPAPYAGGRYLIGSYHDAVNDLDAWIRASCDEPFCALVITDRRTGAQREVPAPPGTFGFIGGGGFSPDGTKIAALAATRGSLVGGDGGGRRMQLVVIDVATTAATLIDQPRAEFGEEYGYAIWSPDGHWVFYGALDFTPGPPQVAVHRVGTHDAVALDLRPGYDVAAVARGVL